MHFLIKHTSLRQLILISFIVALTPLAVSVWKGHTGLNEVRDRLHREVEQRSRIAGDIESLYDTTIDIENAIQQYVSDPVASNRQLASNHIDRYKNDLQHFCASTDALASKLPCQLQQENLSILASAFSHAKANQVNEMLRDLRSQQARLTRWAWQQLSRGLQTQRDSIEHLHGSLSWQSAALATLSLAFAIWGTLLIANPIKRLARKLQAVSRTDGFKAPSPATRGPRDIDELDAYLDWLSNRLERLETLRQSLLRHAPHELKTPLASLKEGCSLLSDGIIGPMNPRQQEVLDLLDNSIERISRLTGQLLDYNLVLQRVPPQREPLDTDEILKTTISRHQPTLAQRGQTFETHCGSPRLHTDPKLLQLILDNLIDNARTHGEPGGMVSLEFNATPSHIVIELANTGPKIPEANKEALFEPFQRGRTSSHNASPGSGLGLAIVARCASQLGGRAEFGGRENFDVCVRVFLPVPTTQPA